jgi:hypothetical protein
MTVRAYPADPAEAALALFMAWFGSHYARSTNLVSATPSEGVIQATASVGRRWDVAVTVVNTLAAEATLGWEAARAAIEERLDADGRSLVLWVPRGAALPVGEPGVSQIIAAVPEALQTPDGRLELRRPVTLFLRRTSNEGSVVTVMGGLQASWARFTNRVTGSFQLQSADLYRLPGDETEREDLFDRIVLAAGQPAADGSEAILATDTWTANDLGEGRSCVVGNPQPESDEQSASLRRNLRRLLRQASTRASEGSPASQALVVLGAATYAEEEKLSWALRGMDPGLYAGYDIIAVIADGLVKGILEPARGTLPWDAPLG